MKVSIEAPSNIAFIKYWGAKDLERAIPWHPSISMSLDRCRSQCSVEFLDGAEGEDEVWLADGSGRLEDPGPAFRARALAHLDRLRVYCRRRGRFVVGTRNTFPSAAGIASSASGFAALTIAALGAMEHPADERELSILARRSGSGSAARSVLGGFVEWPKGEAEEDCFAVSLAGAEHWDLCDVVAVVESGPKKVSSLEGHARASTSPYYERRRELVVGRLERTREALCRRDFQLLGSTLEEDSIDMHLIMMSSSPPIFYWSPATLRVLERVRSLRDEGVPAFATNDAGANVHVICASLDEAAVAAALAALPGVERTIRDRVGQGPRPLETPLI